MPASAGTYAGSVIAILAMGVVSTGLKTAKGALGLHWSHQRVLQPAKVTSVWLPQHGQAAEALIKTSIIGKRAAT